ncbi:hypothetical protein [Yersinia sp. Marseille-Q5920]|uniref:hypothetical protein n=1 Tax=Yersinia sp. Marseille-Q5920 TaxID=2972785 RepID=UPI0022643425|nr:hypothetical protein [Yersinia sp. Marseille-Q5920]
MNYKNNNNFNIDIGFFVNQNDVLRAVQQTNISLGNLPSTLFNSIDYKTTSAMIGSVYCDALARITNSIVNPIEKGHPDILPKSALNASEEQLRNYPQGLEIKCTVGNITTGANLRAGQNRIDSIIGLTWQAHHQEVEALMGLVWDFVDSGKTFFYPSITAVFYSNELNSGDWGAISGTTGRNTKVSGMLSSGKRKMAEGWIAVLDNPKYIERYGKSLGFTL